jgi:hypothetical protein
MSAPDSTITNEHVAVDESYPWRYTVPPRSDTKLQLLTVGDVAVHGQWRGKLGEFYKAWTPMPKRDKKREKELGLLDSKRWKA